MVLDRLILAPEPLFSGPGATRLFPQLPGVPRRPEIDKKIWKSIKNNGKARKPREIQENPKKNHDILRKIKENQENPGKSQKIQKKTWKSNKILENQENPKKSNKIQEKTMNF